MSKKALSTLQNVFIINCMVNILSQPEGENTVSKSQPIHNRFFKTNSADDITIMPFRVLILHDLRD